jgi:hypothetical protein
MTEQSAITLLEQVVRDRSTGLTLPFGVRHSARRDATPCRRF